jgi:hypothetical protein
MKTSFSKVMVVVLTGLAVTAFAAEATKNFLKPTAKVDSWAFEQHDGAKAAVKIENDAIAVTVEEITGTEWHVQLIQPGLALQEGKPYEVSFKAKASARRAIQVYAGVAEDDYHAIGLDELLTINTSWTEHKITFTAETVAAKANNRLGFLLGQDKGTVWLKDVVLAAK